MWTFTRGVVGIKLYIISIEYEIPAAGSYTSTYNLVLDKWLEIGDR